MTLIQDLPVCPTLLGTPAAWFLWTCCPFVPAIRSVSGVSEALPIIFSSILSVSLFVYSVNTLFHAFLLLFSQRLPSPSLSFTASMCQLQLCLGSPSIWLKDHPFLFVFCWGFLSLFRACFWDCWLTGLVGIVPFSSLWFFVWVEVFSVWRVRCAWPRERLTWRQVFPWLLVIFHGFIRIEWWYGSFLCLPRVPFSQTWPNLHFCMRFTE